MKKVKKARPARKAAAKAVSPYSKHLNARSRSAGGSIDEELASAAQGPAAATALRRFLKKYEPPDGEYQDGFHRNRVRAAQRELMRLEYINGNVKAGDKLLAKLEDPDG